ncbi:hypothetical protein ACFYXP_39555 [Streptomyces sp. NPDC002466]
MPSYQIFNMIFGGFAPLAAVSLSAAVGGHYWPAAAMLMLISAIGIWCTLRLHSLAAPSLPATDTDSVTNTVKANA